MAQTPAELIAEKGERVIAKVTDSRLGTVRVWKTRNRIPRSKWAELVEAFPDLTVDRLKGLERPPS